MYCFLVWKDSNGSVSETFRQTRHFFPLHFSRLPFLSKEQNLDLLKLLKYLKFLAHLKKQIAQIEVKLLLNFLLCIKVLQSSFYQTIKIFKSRVTGGNQWNTSLFFLFAVISAVFTCRLKCKSHSLFSQMF